MLSDSIGIGNRVMCATLVCSAKVFSYKKNFQFKTFIIFIFLFSVEIQIFSFPSHLHILTKNIFIYLQTVTLTPYNF